MNIRVINYLYKIILIVKLFTTAYKEGNLLRFINDYEEHNVRAVYIPYKNKWNVYYKAIKDI